jgi:hypothetical protein
MTTAVRNSAGMPPFPCRSSLGSVRGGRNAVTSWLTALMRDVDGGDQREERAAPRATRSRVRARQPEHRGERRRRRRRATPPPKTTVGVAQHPAVHRLAGLRGRYPVAAPAAAALVDEVVADVRAERRLGPAPAGAGELDGGAGHLLLAAGRSAGRSARPRGGTGRAWRRSCADRTPAGSRAAPPPSRSAARRSDCQSRCAMVRRLVMLFAIITCVSARCCVARAAHPPRQRVVLRSTARSARAADTRPGQAELVQEARDEHRRERRVRRDEIVEHRAVARLPPRWRDLDARRPRVGLDLVHPLHGAQRHAPHALDQRQPEHGRQRPELADRKRDTSWNAETKSSRFSRSTRASECEISVIASS